MRLRPLQAVHVANGSCVLPLTRAWHSLGHGHRSTVLLHRPV
jgi:hypothetical protein